MDHEDGDHIVDVPDTPDRLANHKVNERSSVREGKKDLSMSCHSGKQEFFYEGTKNQPMLIDSRTKKLSIRPPNGNRSSGDALHRSNSPAFIGGSTSSSRSTPIFRKGLAADKNPSYESHDSIHIPHVQNERPSCSSKSTSSQDDCFGDLTRRNVPSNLLGKAFSGGAPRSNQVDDLRIRPGLANVPSSNNMAKFSMMSREASERTENMNKVGSSIDDGGRVEFVGNIQNKPGQYGFPALDPNSSPRINRQKRLVRNGCISPHNIAKAKQLAGKDDNGFVAAAHADTTSMASTGPPVWNDIKELVAEDHNSYKGKGKGVMNYPEKELDNKNKHLLSRNSLSINEKDIETTDNISGASKSTEKSSGWRSTHNRTRKMSLRSSDEEGFPSREIDASQCARKHHENRLSRKEKGSSVAIEGDYHWHPDLVSSQLVPAQPVGETVSHPRPRLAQCNGHRSAANTLMKRQKQGSISISSVEGSTSTNDDSEIVLLSSSGEPSNPRSTSSGTSRLQPIIEIDDSPELKRESNGEDARARQLEADEMLARELQEQFYNEMPVLGVGEVDEHIALALQQEESGHTVSRGSNQTSDPRDSLIANLRRQSYSRSSLNLSRRGSQVRASTSGRTTRLRGRFPGQPRTLSSQSRGRNSLFPASMDVDMRMHILETLEAFSDMGVDRSALQVQRDFNETDYEMLLALDDNNDQHGGASTHLINGLPQSTVQNANFEEACAICLETPTIGDTIRHLPCLHKFHKDCIDPWLRRRTSCPVCKSSIT